MTAEQVVLQLGQPLQVRPVGSPESGTEIWAYQFRTKEVEPVQIDADNTTITNHVTGEIQYIESPIYAEETVTLLETFDLLMQEGLVVSWRSQSTEIARSMSDP